jgi:hypothetical protein
LNERERKKKEKKKEKRDFSFFEARAISQQGRRIHQNGPDGKPLHSKDYSMVSTLFCRFFPFPASHSLCVCLSVSLSLSLSVCHMTSKEKRKSKQ